MIFFFLCPPSTTFISIELGFPCSFFQSSVLSPVEVKGGWTQGKRLHLLLRTLCHILLLEGQEATRYPTEGRVRFETVKYFSG